jgi:glycosyltransferase involved in cell wall biosynthesis
LADVTRFFGTRDDVACLLGAADLLALASDTEGVPGVALEAGYLGLPVVATRVGGVPECVVHGETGLLVEPGDSGALMTALSRLAADPELRLRLGSAGRERVRDRHSIDHVADMFVDFYELVQKTRS